MLILHLQPSQRYRIIKNKSLSSISSHHKDTALSEICILHLQPSQRYRIINRNPYPPSPAIRRIYNYQQKSLSLISSDHKDTELSTEIRILHLQPSQGYRIINRNPYPPSPAITRIQNYQQKSLSSISSHQKDTELSTEILIPHLQPSKGYRIINRNPYPPSPAITKIQNYQLKSLSLISSHHKDTELSTEILIPYLQPSQGYRIINRNPYPPSPAIKRIQNYQQKSLSLISSHYKDTELST